MEKLHPAISNTGTISFLNSNFGNIYTVRSALNPFVPDTRPTAEHQVPHILSHNAKEVLA